MVNVVAERAVGGNATRGGVNREGRMNLGTPVFAINLRKEE
jgi:hypothetical protein